MKDIGEMVLTGEIRHGGELFLPVLGHRDGLPLLALTLGGHPLLAVYYSGHPLIAV